jgi:hypothetical protein
MTESSPSIKFNFRSGNKTEIARDQSEDADLESLSVNNDDSEFLSTHLRLP